MACAVVVGMCVTVARTGRQMGHCVTRSAHILARYLCIAVKLLINLEVVLGRMHECHAVDCVKKR